MKKLALLCILVSLSFGDSMTDLKVKKQCKYIIEKSGIDDPITSSLLSGIVVGVRISAYTGEFPEKWDNPYIYKLGCLGVIHNKSSMGSYMEKRK